MERRTLLAPDGTTLSLLDSGGEGPPVVILHGLAGSATEFVPTADALDEHRVLLLDLRGHGHSTRTPEDVSREAYVADVVHIIETEVGSPVALVGQSMGAHTAMLVAAHQPDLVSKLVLLECGAAGETTETVQDIGEYFRSWPIPFADRESAEAFLGDSAISRAWIADLQETPDGLRPRFDAEVMERTLHAVAAPRWREWEQVTAPTLVFYAHNGMFDDAAKAAFVQRGRHALRRDLASGSHDAHLDAHDEWIAVLRSFLTEP